jgi:LuxR family maltose regulon positive regulatory protein
MGAPAFPCLTPRQIEILQLLCSGLSNKEIARTLNLGSETIKSHIKSIFERLAVSHHSGAIERARRLGIIGS